MSDILAVDLGGTHVRVARVGRDGEVVGRIEEHTGDDPELLLRCMADARGDTHRAVVGVPGRVDYVAGRLEFAPNLSAAWHDVLDQRRLSQAVGMPVAIANDADLAAAGEATFGAGRGYDDVAYLTISTGIGAGVVLRGKLVHARRSLAEIGHTLIGDDTVEHLGSGTALGGNGEALVERVRAGDPEARRTWDRVIGFAAVGAVNLVHVFMPEVLVVGGGVGRNGDLVLDPIRKLLEEKGPRNLPEPVVVVTAELGDDAGLAGAAAWERLFP